MNLVRRFKRRGIALSRALVAKRRLNSLVFRRRYAMQTPAYLLPGLSGRAKFNPTLRVEALDQSFLKFVGHFRRN
jgi:hypothetical protein